MIRVKAIYIGNDAESYVQTGFSDGVNIITSVDNHVGKTIVMQSIMYVLGADAKFPPSFKHKKYLFIVDIDVDGQAISILRNGDLFVVKNEDEITPIESKRDFDDYWSNNICRLPSIIKNGSSTLAGLSIYTQMAFVPQADRSTSKTLDSYFNKDDFIEMIYALCGLSARQMEDKTIKELKQKQSLLKTREKELSKQAAALRKEGSSLSAVSPTADHEEKNRLISELDKLSNEIIKLKKRRNHAYIRMKKNHSVLKELRSLNREIKIGSIVCMNCGSESIGYKMPEGEFIFDITTDDMRSQIIRTVQSRIDSYATKANELDVEIREAQGRFNSVAEMRNITLEDIYAARENYGDLEHIDNELTAIRNEIDEISRQLKEAKQLDKELSESRKNYNATLVDTMNSVRLALNDGSKTDEYDSLFTKTNSPYIGSEATEFLLARTYSLAKHVGHGLPVLIDSFRAEELSTSREERALPFFETLQNQTILSATLKEQESGKYANVPNIHNIDYTGYRENQLLSIEWNTTFKKKVDTFGIIMR